MSTATGGVELPLVPPRRFGALLVERRTESGLSLDELAERSEGRFDAALLEEVEQGVRWLDDATVRAVSDLYDVEATPVLPARASLVVDLDEAHIRLGRQLRPLPPDADLDAVLRRYVSLLQLLRGSPPGTRLALRSDDLEVLSQTLEESIAELERRLVALMLAGGDRRFAELRHRLAVPAAGFLVGLTTVGALVLVEAPRPARGSLVAPALPAGDVAGSRVELGDAVTLIRGGSDARPLSGPAAGGSGVGERGEPHRLGAEATAMISWPWQEHLPGWQVVFDGPHETLRGNTDVPGRTITVHVRPGDTVAVVADVLAHELGHAIDVTHLGQGDRDRWLAVRGMDTPWWVDSGTSDFHVGSGDFAEAVAALLVGSTSSAAHGEFTSDQLAVARGLVPGL